MHKFTPEFITSLTGVLLYLTSHLLLPVTQTNCFWQQDINRRKKCLKFSPKPTEISHRKNYRLYSILLTVLYLNGNRNLLLLSYIGFNIFIPT